MGAGRRNFMMGAAALGAATVNRRAQAASSCRPHEPVKTGFTVMRDAGYQALRGRKLGLIANPTSVDERLRHIADVLHATPNVRLTAIFGPEHGFRGTAQAGFSEKRSTDPRTGISVYDIYTINGPALDAVFRASGVDLMVFDIQDVGARFYTYIWTLFDSMAACARTGIEILVLDRPNPISGRPASGPVLDPALSSFVGRAPIALRHGMTIGELARLFNTAFIPRMAGRAARLSVIPMRGWTRDLYYDETGLPWVPPSPNMPTVETALAYPGTCLFEGTGLSVGRGTAAPFLTLGMPDTPEDRPWAERVMAMNLPGCLFRECWFTPGSDAFAKRLCHGLQLVLTDRTRFDAVLTGFALLRSAPGRQQPDFWRSGGKTFDILSGQRNLRTMLDRNASLPDIIASWQGDLRRFETLREAHLLY